MYEVVLLQIATAKGDVSGHLQQLSHCERRGLALETTQLNLEHHKSKHTCKHTDRERSVSTYCSRSVLSQEALHVSSGHQLQQDETWQDVQTDPDAVYNVLVAELAARTNS